MFLPDDRDHPTSALQKSSASLEWHRAWRAMTVKRRVGRTEIRADEAVSAGAPIAGACSDQPVELKPHSPSLNRGSFDPCYRGEDVMACNRDLSESHQNLSAPRCTKVVWLPQVMRRKVLKT
jgi:hypothetical protein